MHAELIDCICQAGDVLLRHFGHEINPRIKDSRSSIVTDADLESDRLLRDYLRSRYPQDNLLTEESGFIDARSRRTWVVDPLDGTSNFAAGIPWFGIMVALLEDGVPLEAAMYLPVERTLFTANRGGGARRNQESFTLPAASTLDQALCAFGMDAAAEPGLIQHQARLLAGVVQAARNVRATNSLVDFALTLEGKLGACVNFHTKIWDIAAPWLVFREAGGLLTGHRGEPITFSPGPDACEASYAVVAGPPSIHAELLPLLSSP